MSLKAFYLISIRVQVNVLNVSVSDPKQTLLCSLPINLLRILDNICSLKLFILSLTVQVKVLDVSVCSDPKQTLSCSLT